MLAVTVRITEVPDPLLAIDEPTTVVGDVLLGVVQEGAMMYPLVSEETLGSEAPVTATSTLAAGGIAGGLIDVTVPACMKTMMMMT